MAREDLHFQETRALGPGPAIKGQLPLSVEGSNTIHPPDGGLLQGWDALNLRRQALR